MQNLSLSTASQIEARYVLRGAASPITGLRSTGCVRYGKLADAKLRHILVKASSAEFALISMLAHEHISVKSFTFAGRFLNASYHKPIPFLPQKGTPDLDLKSALESSLVPA